jgi:hypothetical protein
MGAVGVRSVRGQGRPRLWEEDGTGSDAGWETQRLDRRRDTEFFQPFSHQQMPMGIVSGDQTG